MKYVQLRRKWQTMMENGWIHTASTASLDAYETHEMISLLLRVVRTKWRRTEWISNVRSALKKITMKLIVDHVASCVMTMSVRTISLKNSPV